MWNNLIITNIILILAITIPTYVVILKLNCINSNTKWNNLSKKNYLDILWKSFLPGYLCSIFNITVISRFNTGFNGFNFKPFKGIMKLMDNMVYSNSFGIEIDFFVGNFLLFVPLGFLVPLIFKKINSYLNITIVSTCTVLLIELIQIVTFSGAFDIDDVIYNVTGGILGFGLYRIYLFIFYKDCRKTTTLLKGLIPYITLGIIILIANIIYTLHPYGIMPGGVNIYKSKPNDLTSNITLDNNTYDDFVYTVKYNTETEKNMSIVNGIFNNLNIEFSKDSSKTEETYTSIDGLYSIELYDGNSFKFINTKNQLQFEQEKNAKENVNLASEKENECIIDNILTENIKNETLEILKFAGIDISDRCYIEITESYPSMRIMFYGLSNDNIKNVKIANVETTASGEIATISVYNHTYEKTNDKIKVISTNEAFNRLKNGEAGIKLKNDAKVVGVSLSWWHYSTKGFNFPIYTFAIMYKDNLLSNIDFIQVPAWELY